MERQIYAEEVARGERYYISRERATDLEANRSAGGCDTQHHGLYNGKEEIAGAEVQY